jgi:hypothetical protein
MMLLKKLVLFIKLAREGRVRYAGCRIVPL